MRKECSSEAPVQGPEFWTIETAGTTWFPNTLEVLGGLIQGSVMTKEVKTDHTGGNMSTAHSFLHLLVHWHVSVKNIGRCGPFSEPWSYLLFQSRFLEVSWEPEHKDIIQEEMERQKKVLGLGSDPWMK